MFAVLGLLFFAAQARLDYLCSFWATWWREVLDKTGVVILWCHVDIAPKVPVLYLLPF